MSPERQAYITRSAVCLPNAPVASDDIEKVLGMIGGKPSRARRIVLRSNGIVSRHYAIDPATGLATHSNAQLAAEAVRGLVSSDFPLTDIDLLACGTSCADQLMPGHAVMVHGELGDFSCEAVSTAGICAAGILALKYAWLSVLTGQAAHAVATGSEAASGGLHARNFAGECAQRVAALESQPEIAFEKDFLRWMLSDGAGALLVENAPRAGSTALRIDWIDVVSQAGHMPACMYAGAEKLADGSLHGWQNYDAEARAARSIFAVKQDVRLLNESVVEETLGKPLDASRRKHGLQAAEIDWFLPHMSSEYFRQPIADCLATRDFAIPADKWFTNLTSRGNTGSASIFIMLDELLNSGRLRDGDRLLCFIPESGRFTGALMHLTAVRDA